MLSSKFVILCVTLVLAGTLAVADECGACPEMPKHYEELNCTRRKDADGTCCSVAFECPDLKNYATTECMYHGRAYDNGIELTDPKAAANCLASCRCIVRDGEANFICAQVECPEDFQGVQPGCVVQKSLDGCCSHKTICGEEAKQLPECYEDGVRYAEGEKIYPKSNSCYSCICDGHWDNSTSVAANKNCQRVECGIEIHGLRNLRKGCVPVYYGEDSCCPIGYRCPEKGDEVIPIEGRSQESDDPNMMCNYDNLKLHVGQQLKKTDKCVTCSCNNPPLVECVRKPGC